MKSIFQDLAERAVRGCFGRGNKAFVEAYRCQIQRLSWKAEREFCIDTGATKYGGGPIYNRCDLKAWCTYEFPCGATDEYEYNFEMKSGTSDLCSLRGMNFQEGAHNFLVVPCEKLSYHLTGSPFQIDYIERHLHARGLDDVGILTVDNLEITCVRAATNPEMRLINKGLFKSVFGDKVKDDAYHTLTKKAAQLCAQWGI